ncbi:MAG: hypothetical protein JXR77_17235 [Lentisphaeria bacterium]|nr:hypothetical protein [Lentisphaeria bacterium]
MRTRSFALLTGCLLAFAARAAGLPPKPNFVVVNIDGANVWPLLAGTPDAPPAHETFYYYRGLRLEAVRHGDWKLHLPPAKTPDGKPLLYHLKTDIGEATDVAGTHPDMVRQLRDLAAAMAEDLGLDGIGAGCREVGKVENPEALIGPDGKPRAGFEPK